MSFLRKGIITKNCGPARAGLFFLRVACYHPGMDMDTASSILFGIACALGGYLVGQFVWQGRPSKPRPWRGEDGTEL